MSNFLKVNFELFHNFTHFKGTFISVKMKKEVKNKLMTYKTKPMSNITVMQSMLGTWKNNC